MNRLLSALIAPLVIFAYCAPAAATEFHIVADPVTGEIRVAVSSGAVSKAPPSPSARDSTVVVLPPQQIALEPPGGPPGPGRKVDFIDLNNLTESATPAIIEAIIRANEAIGSENAATIGAQKTKLVQDRGKTAPNPPEKDLADLNKLSENLDNLIRDIVNKLIDQRKAKPDQLAKDKADRAKLDEMMARIDADRQRILDQLTGQTGRPVGDSKTTDAEFDPRMPLTRAQFATLLVQMASVGVPAIRNTTATWRDPWLDTVAEKDGFSDPSQQALNKLSQALIAAAQGAADPWASYIYVARNEVTSTVPTAGIFGGATGRYTGLVKGSVDGAPVNGTLNMQVNFGPGSTGVLGSVSGSMNFGSQGTLNMISSLRDSEGIGGGLLGIAFGGQARGEFNGKLFGPQADQVGGTWTVDVVNGMTLRKGGGQFVGGQAPVPN